MRPGRRSRIVAQAVDVFRHRFGENPVGHFGRVLRAHGRGGAEEPRAPSHAQFLWCLGLSCEDRLAVLFDDQSGRHGARGRTVRAARVDIPIARRVRAVGFTHACEYRSLRPKWKCAPRAISACLRMSQRRLQGARNAFARPASDPPAGTEHRRAGRSADRDSRSDPKDR